MKSSEPAPILLFSTNEYLSVYVARVQPGVKFATYFLGPAGQAIRFSRFCKKYFTAAHTDAALVTQINTISKRYHFSAVIPLDLSATVCLARIQSSLVCPVFPISHIDDIMLLANKWKTALLLRSLGIRHPETIFVKTPQELSGTLLPIPFLIKPLTQAGGKGLRKITGYKDITEYKNSFSPYKTFPLIVQEYIEGSDIDLSVVARDGIIYGWTIQRWRKGRELEFVNDPEVLSIGRQLVQRLRYSGFMHIDMRRNEQTGKLYVLECNPRVWGSIAASKGAGVDFIELAVRITQNKHIPRVRQHRTTYLAPVRLLTSLLTDPRVYCQASDISRRDFIGMFTDPLPYIILFVKQLIVNIALKFPYTAGVRKWLVDMERRSYLSHITEEIHV